MSYLYKCRNAKQWMIIALMCNQVRLHSDGKDANCTATVKYFSGMKEPGKKIHTITMITKTSYVLKADWKSNSANMAYETIVFPLYD